MRRYFSILWSLACILIPLVHAACECGYTVNKTTDGSYALFTDILETDFQKLESDALGWEQRNATGWAKQVYNQSAEASRNGGHYGLNVTSSNVIINPLKSNGNHAGEGELGGDAGLQLWVRGLVLDDMISTGQVVTVRDDILYGSFRVGVKMTSVSGTCGAFFWYHNDSQEIDFEYLSWQQGPSTAINRTYHPLNLVIQTPQSAAAGFNAAGTPNFKVVPMPFDPAGDFHELRFDWTPRVVNYYADDMLLASMDYEIPNAPGALFLNHWSNGNPGWSKGPPTQDALMTVSYVKAYFNASSGSEQNKYNEVCVDKYDEAERATRICQIPDQQSYFFTPQGGYHPSSPGHPPTTSSEPSTNPAGPTNTPPQKGTAAVQTMSTNALAATGLTLFGAFVFLNSLSILA